MIDLRPCSSCRRHVADEAACPFCGAPIARSAPHTAWHGRFSRATVFAGATLAGCWTSSQPTSPTTTPETTTTTTTTTTATEHHVDPPVPHTGGVEGVVTDRAGNPLPGVMVAAHAVDKSDSIATDMGGHYIFNGLPPGNVRIEVRVGGPRSGAVTAAVTIASGTVARHDFTVDLPQRNYSNTPMPYGAPPSRRRVV